MDLSERKLICRPLLTITSFSGMPIGSRTISRMWGGRYSPATIRNEMSDLEEMGYLSSRTLCWAGAQRLQRIGCMSTAFCGAKAKP